ncbi:hypothetical protein MA16_Dca012391 [Dendrobium catenatum]|uniref:Uncharacterized protein n=1 Tax=Dendrobium catenatum TaxID=906689 RepID=A0A2I0WYA1_9ASPA|nr:hypothetical protein MA16_Dca012391 [Dendrobium catenatum]
MIPYNATHTSFINLNRTVSIQFNKGFDGFRPLHHTIPIASNNTIMNPKMIRQKFAVMKVFKRNKIHSNQL